MAISNHIIQLVAEALKDKVLTIVEKQTILAEARAQGVPEEEVRAYLDKAVKVRLQHYAKEDLKKCPHCGAQIPLVSDVCLFCDQSLTGSVSNGVSTADFKSNGDGIINLNNLQVCPQCRGANPLNASECAFCGAKLQVRANAFDIINRENITTAEEQINLKNCPNCGAPFPLVSNICPHCQHVLHEQQDSELNIKTLLHNITCSLNMLKSNPKPTFGMVVKFRLSTILFYFASSLLIIGCLGATMFHAICTVLSMLLCPISLVMLFLSYRNKSNNSPVQRSDFFFYKGLHEYEMYSRQTETIYGDNAEANKLLADYAGEIDVYKKLRSQNRNRLSILILCLLVVPVIIHLFAPKGKDEYLSDREQFPVPYQMSSYSKTLLPYPGYDGVYPWYTDYLKVDGNVELMFDVDPQNYQIGLPEREAKTIYRLRVEPMRVLSTGKRIKETDTCNFGVFLFDKDKKRVGRQLGHIRHRNNHESDNIRTVLWKGCGDYYAKFVGDSSSVDAEMMRQIADSAYYFMIF